MATATQEAPKGTEKQFDLNTATASEFVDRVKVDNALRDEYLSNSNDEKFKRINDLLNHPEKQSAPQGAETQKPNMPEISPQQPVIEEVELTNVKIPKDLFGTYLSNGRSAADAVMEALKGNREKDETINNFRVRNDNTLNDTLALRKELIRAQQEKADAQILAESLKQKIQEAESLKFPMQEIENVDFDLLNDVDPFDPASHPKIEKAKNELERLKKVLKTSKQPKQGDQQQKPQVGTDPSQPPASTQAKIDPEVQKQREALIRTADDKEFFDIEALQAAVPELRTPIPFAVLDKAIANFHNSIASAGGGNLGQAHQLYFSATPEGDQFRAQCKARGVEVPQGYETHQFIVGKIRPQRLKNIDNYRNVIKSKTGKDLEPWEVLDAPGISYVELYRNITPYQPQASASQTSPSQKLQEVIARHMVPAPKQNTVPEIPPSMGGPPMISIGDTPAQVVIDLIAKLNQTPKAITKEEAKKLFDIYEYRNVPPPKIVLDKLKE
jgi:hypothetical protein